MQFSKYNDWFQVARITGPSHNLLGLRFGLSDGKVPLVDIVRAGRGPARIDADDVRRQVGEGLTAANARFGKRYGIVAIRYVEDDTPSPEIYRDLTIALIENMVDKQARAAM